MSSAPELLAKCLVSWTDKKTEDTALHALLRRSLRLLDNGTSDEEKTKTNPILYADMLKDEGADIFKANSKGETPYELMQEHYNTVERKIVKLIENIKLEVKEKNEVDFELIVTSFSGAIKVSLSREATKSSYDFMLLKLIRDIQNNAAVKKGTLLLLFLHISMQNGESFSGREQKGAGGIDPRGTAKRLAAHLLRKKQWLNCALHDAARLNYYSIVKELVKEHEADVTNEDRYSRTPLVTALLNGSWQFVEEIEKCVPDVFVTSVNPDRIYDEKGSTILHTSCVPPEILKRLVKSGISVNAADYDGNTPLHTKEWLQIGDTFDDTNNHCSIKSAADSKSAKETKVAVDLLLQHGASVNSQNNKGETPLHVAYRLNQSRISRTEKLLKQRKEEKHEDSGDSISNTSSLERMKESGDKHFELLERKLKTTAVNSYLNQPADYGISLYPNMAGISRQLGIEYDADADFLGNTRAHVAAGVYDFIGETIGNELVVNFAKLTAKNCFGLTPIHVLTLRGKLLQFLEIQDPEKFEEIIRDALRVVDSRGRNNLHLFALTPHGEIEDGVGPYVKRIPGLAKPFINWIASAILNFEIFDLKDMSIIEDDYKRTPMHYAAMSKQDVSNVMMFLDHRCSSMKDRFLRLPLHYAFRDENHYKCFQPSTATDSKFQAEEERDKYGITPKAMKDSFERQVRSSEQYTQLVTRTFSSDLSDLSNNLETAEEMVDAMKSGRQPCLHPGEDAVELTWGIWKNLSYAMRDDSYKLSKDISDKVLRFMQTIVLKIGERDKRFTGRLILVGSAFDGTTIDSANEFDFNVELVEFGEVCEVDTSEEFLPGFVKVEMNSLYKFPEIYTEYFSDDGSLITNVLKILFEKILAEVLVDTEFWKQIADMDLGIEVSDNTTLCDTSPSAVAKTLSLTITGKVDEILYWRPISIDVTPVIRLPNSWLTEAKQELRILKSTFGCYLVFDNPHHKHRIPYKSPHYMRVSFARIESLLVRNFPMDVRAAFMVAKQLADKSVPDDVRYRQQPTHVSTHVMKMALMHSIPQQLITDTYNGLLASSETSEESLPGPVTVNDVDKEQLHIIVENIFKQLVKFSDQDFVPSYFMPDFKLPVWRYEKFVEFSRVFRQQIGLNAQNPYASGGQHTGIEKTFRDITFGLARNYYLLHRVTKPAESPVTAAANMKWLLMYVVIALFWAYLSRMYKS
jgi:ankyrin repeat protein